MGVAIHSCDGVTPPISYPGVKKEILVHIEHTRIPKPFLGGYRNRRTGLEYHNAAVQTLPKRRPDKGVSYSFLYLTTYKIIIW